MTEKKIIENPCPDLRQGFIFILALTTLLQACNNSLSDPQEIIDKTIAEYGGDRYSHSTIEFDFRNRHYKAVRDGGMFSYERVFKDSTSTVHDFLTNNGFIREVNQVKKDIPDSMARKYTSSVNSVIYFASLPYGLNDPSVHKKFLGKKMLEGQSYYKVEITFGQGGGEDFEDVFHYWIHEKNFTMDYMAYTFKEDGIPDIRFRKVLKRQAVKGIIFQDYINYKPKVGLPSLEKLEEQFASGQLSELSKIELENIIVNL